MVQLDRKKTVRDTKTSPILFEYNKSWITQYTIATNTTQHNPNSSVHAMVDKQLRLLQVLMPV